jgi:hypothetical protein
MRSSSLYSFLGIALCVGASLAGCGGDDDDDNDTTTPPKPSAEGESCQSTANCASGLVCKDLTCVKSSASNGGSGGSAGSGSGKGGSAGTSTGKGGTAGTAPAPVLGSEGESCTKRADCEADLHCYNQRCTAGDATGAAGGGGMGSEMPPPPPVLGQKGETCVLPSDCAAGLTCLPGIASGVCGTANTAVTPTGKSCVGECESAADCCQLPLVHQTTYMVKSCADLEAKLDGVDCDDPGANAALCFIQATYCTCDDTWACTDNLCVYRPDCAADGETTDGCPSLSRAGRSLPTTCVDMECGGTVAVSGCMEDADCDTVAVFDDGGDTCSAGECACYEPNGHCYRKCDKNLDCAVGYSCDTKETHLCVQDAACTDDVLCQQKLGDINAVCEAGACVIGCDADVDCNPGGFHMGGFINICNQEKHVCEFFGCRSNEDCTLTGNVHMFCVDNPAPPAGGTMVASAVTD